MNIEAALLRWRESGLMPEDPTLAAEVTRMVVAEERLRVASDLEDHVLDEQEKRTARVRQPLSAGVA